MPDRTAKAEAFWMRVKWLRSLPGHCSRCGGLLNTYQHQTGRKGICRKCREYAAAYRARRRAKRLALPPEVQIASDLARRVHVLETRWKRFARILRAQYKAGYQVGEKAERARWQHMPRGWDAFSQPLDIEVKRQMSHVWKARAKTA